MTGYTRQSAAAFVPDLLIKAEDFNAEFDQLEAAFNTATGHSHTGAIGEGPKLNINNATTGVLNLDRGGTGSTTPLDARVAIGANNAANLTAGTLPGARFDDTSHGNRAGGSLHAAVTTTVNGFMSAADKVKLDGIQTGAQVNPGDATPTAAGLMSAADKTKLNGIAAGAQVNPGVATGAVDGLMSSGDKAKLDGVQAGAQVNPTAAQIKTSYESNSNTNAYTDAEKTKLAGIAAGAQVNTVASVAGKTGAVTLVKADVGLGSVDNTSDANKPVSTAAQTALNDKLSKSGDAITGGYTTTSLNAGTITTGTFAPSPGDRNMHTVTNAGAFTLSTANVTSDTTMVIYVVNTTGAGAITMSGFHKVTGDAFTTTNAHRFFVFITRCGGRLHAHITQIA